MKFITESVPLTPELVAMLREMGAPNDADPVEIKAKWDRQGRVRGVTARWADGWRMTVNLHLSGSYSVSYALRMTTRGKA